MSATGLEVFDKTLQTTHVLLKDLLEDEAIGPTGNWLGTCWAQCCGSRATG